jgi:VanZ family protein
VTQRSRPRFGWLSDPRFWFILAAIWTVAVLVLALTPAQKQAWLFKKFSDKILHASAFVVGGIIWVRTVETFHRLRRGWAFLSGTVAALIVGAAIEFLQMLTPTRKADIYDFLADVVGVLFGLVLLVAISAIRWTKQSAEP